MELDQWIKKSKVNASIANIFIDTIAILIFKFYFLPFPKQYDVPFNYVLLGVCICFFGMDLLEHLTYIIVHKFVIPYRLNKKKDEEFRSQVIMEDSFDEQPRIEKESLVESPSFDDDGIGCYSCKSYPTYPKGKCEKCSHWRYNGGSLIQQMREGIYSNYEWDRKERT